MDRNGNHHTDRHHHAWGDIWWITPKATRSDIQAIVDAARAAGHAITAHPATLERMGRTASPFGPIARSATLTAAVLDVHVTPDWSYPEGLIATHAQ